MDRDVVRWGVLGCADIAMRRVIPAMQAAAGTQVVAIASRNLERAEAAATKLGIERYYGDYEDLLKDPSIDAVYIPLPNTLHAEWTIRSASYGKHVLCEKPMAPTVAECQQMVEACRRAGVRFMEGLMYRMHPQHERVRALIQSGAIGTPAIVRSSFCIRLQRPPQDIRFSPTLGGGALLDVGTYALDAARWLAGAEPIAVTGRTVVDAQGVDVSAVADLVFPGDVLASVTCSFVADGGGSYDVYGSSGRIGVQEAFVQRPDYTPRVTWKGGEEVFPAGLDQHRLMFDAFSTAILNGEPQPFPDDAGIGNIAAIAALRRQA
jgi:predicted dehydrogenase